MCEILLDNDVVAKAIAFCLVEELLTVLKKRATEVGVLGTLTYALSPKRLRSAADGGDNAYGRLKALVRHFHVLEPTEDEVRLAIIFEEESLKAGTELDVGESQLFAIATQRHVQKVCTGDKRAITSLELLCIKRQELSRLKGKVIPLEELARAMVAAIGHEHVRACICAARGTDLALEICFQCHNEQGNPAETEAGLRSYLLHLRRTAPTVCGTLNPCS